MKNKKIIDAFDSILPNSNEKYKILYTIVKNKKNRSSKNILNFTFKITAPLAALSVIVFILINSSNKEHLGPALTSLPESRSVPIRTFDNKSALDVKSFVYENILYERLGEILDINNIKGDLLFIVEEKDNSYYKAEVYKNKFNENTVIVYFNDVYEEYLIIE